MWEKMFENLIKVAIESAMKNPDIEIAIKKKINEAKKNFKLAESKENIIDLDNNNYKVLQ